jgi:hypothetical protein
VAEELDLPPIPIVANPPPPGAYSGPRLSVFAHILDPAAVTGELSEGDGLIAVDDGLWLDPLTLEPGDRFVQIHRFDLGKRSDEAPYVVELGLYDPMTGERRAVLDSAGRPAGDRVILPARDS